MISISLPHLFDQGDLPGPELLLKYQTGALQSADLKATWAAARILKSRKVERWPDTMPLLCRGCSERCGTDIQKPLKEFGFHTPEKQWSAVNIVILGFKSRPERTNKQRNKESDLFGSARLVSGRFGSDRLDLGSTRLGSAGLGSARLGSHKNQKTTQTRRTNTNNSLQPKTNK
jgi:hypothetical protein